MPMLNCLFCACNPRSIGPKILLPAMGRSPLFNYCNKDNIPQICPHPNQIYPIFYQDTSQIILDWVNSTNITNRCHFLSKLFVSFNRNYTKIVAFNFDALHIEKRIFILLNIYSRKCTSWHLYIPKCLCISQI